MKWVSLVRAAKHFARRATNTLSRVVAWHLGAPARYLILASQPDGPKVRRILQRLPFYFDPVPLEPHIRVQPEATLADLFRARVVVEVDEGRAPALFRTRLDHVAKADFDRNPLDGWELCRISQVLAGLPTRARRRESHRLLTRVIQNVRTTPKQKVYVFGTGPSLAKAMDRDFSDGHVIVCNTIVRDKALWRHLNPSLFVAGDAIYHFGHTAHARAFRADLKERLIEANGAVHFVYPELFDAIVQREFEQVRDILIPVPFGEHTDVHVNLCERFELPALGNVLNILLLPLGCTLSKSVWLWGFDGRAPDDKLFWSNSPRQAYPELMPGLLADHPAFFAKLVPKGLEQTYVQTVHGDALDQRLRTAEASGYQFVMMHFSWTETLNKRVVSTNPRPQGDVPR